MIKKLLTLSAVIAGVMMSGQVLAATAAISTSTTVTPTHCPALANNITVQVSKDVMAGFNCGQFSYAAATCHATGTNKPQTVVAVYDLTVTPNVLLAGYTNCSTNATTGVETCSFNGRVGFRGTSAGGSVGAAPLGDLACNTTNVVTLVPDSVLDSTDTSGTTQP